MSTLDATQKQTLEAVQKTTKVRSTRTWRGKGRVFDKAAVLRITTVKKKSVWKERRKRHQPQLTSKK